LGFTARLPVFSDSSFIDAPPAIIVGGVPLVFDPHLLTSDLQRARGQELQSQACLAGSGKIL